MPVNSNGCLLWSCLSWIFFLSFVLEIRKINERQNRWCPPKQGELRFEICTYFVHWRYIAETQSWLSHLRAAQCQRCGRPEISSDLLGQETKPREAVKSHKRYGKEIRNPGQQSRFPYLLYFLLKPCLLSVWQGGEKASVGILALNINKTMLVQLVVSVSVVQCVDTLFVTCHLKRLPVKNGIIRFIFLHSQICVFGPVKAFLTIWILLRRLLNYQLEFLKLKAIRDSEC